MRRTATTTIGPKNQPVPAGPSDAVECQSVAYDHQPQLKMTVRTNPSTAMTTVDGRPSKEDVQNERRQRPEADGDTAWKRADAKEGVRSLAEPEDHSGENHCSYDEHGLGAEMGRKKKPSASTGCSVASRIDHDCDCPSDRALRVGWCEQSPGAR